VNNDEKEHANRVLEECAKKVCKNMTSNFKIHATNAYLKAHGVHVNDFNEHSATFLIVD
jgi:2'-5' RNA ligase